MLPVPRGCVHQHGQYLCSAAARKILLCGPSSWHSSGFLMLDLGISCSCAAWDVLRCPQMFLQLTADLENKVQLWLCCSGQGSLLFPCPDTCFSTGFGSLSLLKGADVISRNNCWTVLVPRTRRQESDHGLSQAWDICPSTKEMVLSQEDLSLDAFSLLGSLESRVLVNWWGFWMLPSVCSWKCHGQKAADTFSQSGGLLLLALFCQCCGFY